MEEETKSGSTMNVIATIKAMLIVLDDEDLVGTLELRSDSIV